MRVHFALVVVLTLVSLSTGAVLQWEHLGPDAELSPATFQDVYTIHSIAIWGSVLPLGAGVLSAIALPRALELRTLSGWWLVPVSVVAWVIGLALLLASHPSRWSHALMVAGLGCLGLAIVGTLATHRARIAKSPLLVAGLGAAAVLQLLLCLQVIARLFAASLGIAMPSGGLANLLLLSVPVVMGLAAHAMERHVGRPIPNRALAGAAMIAPTLMPWLPKAAAVSVVASLSVLLFTLVLLLHLRNASRRLHAGAIGPIAIAGCVALRIMTHAYLRSGAPSFLRDTYMLVAPEHASALALFLGLVLVVANEPELLANRTPRERLLRTGVSMLAGGFGLACSMMLVVGWQGMPRRYHLYVPAFTTTFRVMATFAAIGLVGAVLVGLAFAGSRRAARTPSRQGLS